MNVWEFIQQHGRPPELRRGEQPWTVQGWLLCYVQQWHFQGGCGNRWGYHLATAEAGRLLPDPIPRLDYKHTTKQAERELDKAARLIGWDAGGWNDFARLVEWLAWGLLVGKELPKLEEKTHEQLYTGFSIGPFLTDPCDYFGYWICESRGKGWNPSGFYPTPHEVVELMVAMQMHDEGPRADGRDPRTLSVCDPCVGTGRMLLHASNHSLRLFGQDINWLVLQCCLINLALYAPWGAFPLPKALFPAEGFAGTTPLRQIDGRLQEATGQLLLW